MAAAMFGTLPILAKLGYAAGMTVEQLLAPRFLIAGLAMTVVALIAGQGSLRMRRRSLLALFGMGVFGYGGQTLMFFTALTTLPASLVELIQFVYPALVVVGAWAIYGRAISIRRLWALLASFTGITLLVGGVRLQISLDLIFAFAVPVAYTIYLLVGEHVMRETPALAAGAVMNTGAAAFWVAILASRGHLIVPPNLAAWLVLGGLAIGPSMVAIPLLLSSLSRIGSDRVALLSTVEPVITVGLAFSFLGERFSSLQALGAVFVLGSILRLQLPVQTSDGR